MVDTNIDLTIGGTHKCFNDLTPNEEEYCKALFSQNDINSEDIDRYIETYRRSTDSLYDDTLPKCNLFYQTVYYLLSESKSSTQEIAKVIGLNYSAFNRRIQSLKLALGVDADANEKYWSWVENATPNGYSKTIFDIALYLGPKLFNYTLFTSLSPYHNGTHSSSITALKSYLSSTYPELWENTSGLNDSEKIMQALNLFWDEGERESKVYQDFSSYIHHLVGVFKRQRISVSSNNSARLEITSEAGDLDQRVVRFLEDFDISLFDSIFADPELTLGQKRIIWNNSRLKIVQNSEFIKSLTQSILNHAFLLESYNGEENEEVRLVFGDFRHLKTLVEKFREEMDLTYPRDIKRSGTQARLEYLIKRLLLNCEEQ